MDIFAQKKFLIRMVVVLAILNLLSIGLFVWKDLAHRPPHRPPGGPYRDVTGILEKELKLTSEQLVKFNTLRSDFFEKERELHETIRRERDSMNAEMFNMNTDEILVKAIASRVSQNEYRMELLRIEQAGELKRICTPEQLKKFEELVIEIRDYFRPDNQPPPGK